MKSYPTRKNRAARARQKAVLALFDDLARKDYRSERYADWIAHVRTALPQIADIGVWEREDDHHAYFTVRYRGGHTVRSSGLSEGTLRILTLTLLPYLRSHPGILVTEEPQINGVRSMGSD